MVVCHKLTTMHYAQHNSAQYSRPPLKLVYIDSEDKVQKATTAQL